MASALVGIPLILFWNGGHQTLVDQRGVGGICDYSWLAAEVCRRGRGDAGQPTDG